MVEIVFSGKSDKGLKRSNNEDAFVCEATLGLAALADGMGGAAAGEKASELFILAVLEAFSNGASQTEPDSVRQVQTAYELANRKILNHVEEYPEHSGMGCTGELLIFYDRTFAVGHIGDSRTYLFREGSLRRLTRDHSLVQDQVDRGIITPDEARKHHLQHVILKAVGVAGNLEVDHIKGEAVPGDVFLLCSDGLTDMVDDATISAILSLPHDLALRAESLVEAANSAGGRDNITVVLGEVLQ
jgi:PPM family protein phosphatase